MVRKKNDLSGTHAERTGGSSASSDNNAPEDLDLLKDSLGYALKRAQVRAYDLLFATIGPEAISPARMTALSIIGTQAGASQSALAEQLGINRASVVKVIDTLESLRLVERRPVEGDRRSYSLVLTPLGRSELKALHKKVRSYEEAIARALTAQERLQLIDLLEKVAVTD